MESTIADPPKKKKALPFKRTVARSKPLGDAPTDSDRPKEAENDIEFFRRGKDVFPIVLEEVERRVETEKTKSPENHERKRRKVSLDSEDGVSWKKRSFGSVVADAAVGKEKSSVFLDSSDDEGLIIDVKGKGKDIIRTAKTLTPRKAAPRSSTIDLLLDDDSDGDFPAPSSARKSVTAPTPTRSTRSRHNSSPVNIIDDELDIVKTKPKIEEEPDVDLKEIDPPDPFDAWVLKAKELESRNKDVVAQFMITSQLPSTVPLVVRRRLGQGMKLMLDTWVQTQKNNGIDVPDYVAASLFLTWKGKKVYNHSTPCSLGVQVNSRGELAGTDGEGYARGGMHFEVWTEDAHAHYLKDKERERAAKLGFAGDDAFGSDPEKEPTPEPEKKGIKVILKAKEFEPVRCSIHDDTTVAKLIETFRGQRQIEHNQSISIYFDGEKLDEGSLVVEADIDPDDTNQFEVHIK